MTRDTEPVGTSESRSTEPIPIGFFPSYLPSSSAEIGSLSHNKDPPPYPLNISSGTFPVPYSIEIPSSSKNSSLDVKLSDKAPSDVSPSAPSMINLKNEKRLTNFEREEIMNALLKMESKVLSKSAEEKKEFLREYNKVIDAIDDVKSRLSKEEKGHFEKEIRRMNGIRSKHLKEQSEKHKDEEIDRKNANDEAGETDTKCSFDITLLLLKFPQLIVDVILCVKVVMTRLTTFSGAIFFTTSLTAALFTTYYLILHCICRRNKRTQISEFLHSLVCTVVFLIVSSYSNDDEHLRAFGFLASVPYGCEVCWKSWNFLKEQKMFLSTR